MIYPPVVDSHAHVWDRTCHMIAGARYHPDYEADIDTYLRILDDHNLEKAVLVQPSFLGTDNSYLLDALRRFPDRLRGIVVVDPGIAEHNLIEMAGSGVIGIRLNTLSMAPEALNSEMHDELIRRASQLGLWIEVQAKGVDWPTIAGNPAIANARLMIDHFGLPSGPDCPGLKALLNRNPATTVVKVSAPYRVSNDLQIHAAKRFLEQFGPQRCLWGSDWPWTQHEDRHSYGDSIDWLDHWTNPDQRRAMITAAPGLLGF